MPATASRSSIARTATAGSWRAQRLAVLGGGLGAARLGLSLKTWSDDVLARTHGAPSARSGEARLARNGIDVRTTTIARLEHDEGALREIVFEDGETVTRDALFFTTGQHPHSDLAVRLGLSP